MMGKGRTGREAADKEERRGAVAGIFFLKEDTVTLADPSTAPPSCF